MYKKLHIIILLLFSTIIANSQTTSSVYKIGDIVNETIPLFDTALKPVNFTIPIKGSYVLVYRYRTVSIGKGFDNADSIKLLEEKISDLLLGGMVGNLKVICMSYDKITNYDEWVNKIKTNRPFKPSKKYKVEYLNFQGIEKSEQKCRELFTKLSMFGPDGKLLRNASSIAKFNYHIKDEKINVKGKLVTKDSGKLQPLENTTVHITSDNKNDTLGKTTTDKFGDFDIKIVNNEADYTINAIPKNKATNNVILLTQEGKQLAYLIKSISKFDYKLLKTDVLELAEMPEDDDITLTFNKFEKSKQNQLIVIENINYGFEKYTIESEAEQNLNKVVEILKLNPKIKLEIKSFTDSQGDDNTNLELSKKRANAVADYLIKNGIEQKRITAIGRGENDIRNRCYNGVACSDKEHKYNRRTEFLFIK
jgi:outer membrane protein OmpA-like peptidoglycan-associated protein